MHAQALVFLSFLTVPSQCQSNSKETCEHNRFLIIACQKCFFFLIASSLISFATGEVIVGGMDKFYLRSVEIFPPPLSDTCSIPQLPEGRYRHSLSLLSGGKLVVCGGWSGSSKVATSCIVWTPESRSWTNMHTSRSSYYIFKCSS